MDAKRRWKYKKDIFGKRYRKYYVENIFGVDKFDMKLFRALKLKLSRDYLVFFSSLSKLYERGEFKKVSEDAIATIRRTVSIVSAMIDSGTLDKKDVDTIVENVNQLNQQRDFLVQKSEAVQALKGRLEQVEDATGISPEVLGITEKSIRKGARREAQKRKEGILPFLKRTMPKTHGLAGQIAGGLGTALLGPFAPIAKMAGGALSDIFGLGKGLFQKFHGRKESRLGRLLSPMGYAKEKYEESGVGGRGSGVTRGRRKREGTDVLLDFFNKGAYRAKWTRELLKKISGVGGKEDGFWSKFLKMPGTVGAVTVGAAVIGLLTGKWIREQLEKDEKVWKSYHESQRNFLNASQMWFNHYIELIENAKKDQPKIDEITKIIKTREILLEAAPKQLKRDPFSIAPVEVLKQMQKESTQILTKIQKEGVEKLSITEQKRFLELASTPIPETEQELLEQVKKLADSVSELSKNINKRSTTSIREPGIGNPWDTSDPLTVGIASSAIDMED